MMRIAVLGAVVCLTVVACDKDPARSVKITQSPAPAAADEPKRPTDDIRRAPPRTSPLSPRDAQRAAAWRPDGCPPLPIDATGSDVLSVEGPCTFEHRAPVACEALADDFLVTMSRKGALGSTVMVYINVEKYKGPGHYDGAQMFVGVQDKTNIYRWSSDEVTITVGENEAFTVLPRTKLTAEPLLVRCSGPMTNYQCGAVEFSTAIEDTVTFVTGTLRCDKPGKTR